MPGEQRPVQWIGILEDVRERRARCSRIENDRSTNVCVLVTRDALKERLGRSRIASDSGNHIHVVLLAELDEDVARRILPKRHPGPHPGCRIVGEPPQ